MTLTLALALALALTLALALQGGDFYKQKGTVEKLVDRYTAHVRMHEAGGPLKLSNPDPTLTLSPALTLALP